MKRRSKWTKRQDKSLIKFVKEFGDKNWDYIAIKINEKKINKNAKQCRERWQNQLDPLLTKGNWSIEEKKLIFSVHNKIGNKWTEIAEYFQGRTDHLIKNQFFSLIRRSLRTAKRFLKEDHQDLSINDLKPKVLCDFIRRKKIISFPDYIKVEKKEIEVNFNKYFMKFCFSEVHNLVEEIKDDDVYIIKKSFDFLIDLNCNYIRLKKIKKSKKLNQLIERKAKKNLSKFSKIKIPLNKISKEELIIEKFHLKRLFNNKNLLDKLLILEKKRDELNLKQKIFFEDIQNLVNKKNEYLENIRDINDISHLMYSIINEISQDELKNVIKKARLGFRKLSQFKNESTYSQNNFKLGQLHNLKSESNFQNLKSENNFDNLKSENNFHILKLENHSHNLKSENNFNLNHLKSEKNFKNLKSEKNFQNLKSENNFINLKSENNFNNLKSENNFNNLKSENNFNNLKSENNFQNLKSENNFQNLKSETNLNSLRNGEIICKSRFHKPKSKLRIQIKDTDSVDTLNFSPKSIESGKYLRTMKKKRRNFELSHFARKVSNFRDNTSLNVSVSVSDLHEDSIKNINNSMSLRGLTPEASDLEF